MPQRSKLSKTLGETIRAERIKAGLSQEQLAERASLARNYIGNIERAEYKVTVETLAQIAKALGVRVRDLVADLWNSLSVWPVKVAPLKLNRLENPWGWMAWRK